ncbi:MAG: type I DNA topoisomerase [Bacteroidia bacterium]|nr:type I DNA topoisomerase [Bacteroidia bacterium]
MQKNLVIVESPAKAKTIEKFLGKDFKVLSSYGHIRDLKKKEFSIDIEDDFQPHYEVPTDKQTLVNELKKEAKKAETVWLASDEDREGEAIAWHLYEVLKLKPENTKRIVFHEITKTAILKAIEQPRDINIDLVNAQQARRILDRIVGFELSPVLWKKVKPALSAGRVQSVTVRLVVEREREVNAFVSEASYRVTAIFLVPDVDGKTVEMKAELPHRLKTKAEAEALLNNCRSASYVIEDITKRPVKKSPAAPFTTSTLQQEAARKLGYTVAQTMIIAQRLYESGFITYMRTDSVNLSEYATQGCKETIANLMGAPYVHPRHFETKSKGAQEAHEAIRPTYIENQTVEGNAQEKRLYDLIWKRTIASQMADAELEKTTATIRMSVGGEAFTAIGEVIKFDGFLRVYRESFDDDNEQESEGHLLPPLAIGQQLERVSVSAVERFTQRPARYTEASLVRKLEELGIGRPSTYAPTISTIQQREYVEKDNRDGEERSYNVLMLKGDQFTDEVLTEVVGAEKSKLFPTDIGIVVNDFLTEYFPNILDYNFTARVEKEFDEVADGEVEWTSIMKAFYEKFHPSVEKTLSTKTEHKVGERMLGQEPATGKPVSVKIGRYGPVVQIGSADDEEKPRFAQMKKGQSMETISLEEALELFKLPRSLGDYEDKKVNVGVGRFGPYIQHNGGYVSLPKEVDPMKVSLDEAIELILEKRAKEAARHIKTFDEEPELEILNGRYGPYMAYKGSNYKIPKDIVPQDLSLKSCLELIKLQDEKAASAPKRKRGATKKKA